MKFKNDVEIQNSDLIVGTDIYTTGDILKIQAGGTNGTYIEIDDTSSEVVVGADIFANNLSGTNTGDQDLSNYVTTNTTQTISGAKTFSASQTIINGNVGIGTDSPQSKLHVSGGNSIETTLIIGAEGTGSDKSARVFLNEGEGGITNSKDYGFSLAYDGQGAQYGGLSANQFGILRHNNNANGDAVIVMNRTNDNVTFNGNVGINELNPSAKLEISDTTLAEARITSYPASGYGGQSNLWLSTGQFGSSMIALGYSSSGTAATAAAGIRYDDSNDQLTIKTNFSDRLTINSSGTVRILGSGSASALEFGTYGGKIISNYSTLETNYNFKVNGSVIVGDPNAMPSSGYAGALRYRVSGNNSYVDMCMQTGASTYAWTNIVQNQW